MTIEQTVDITADRRLHLDFEVPREVSADKARVIIQFPVIKDTQLENTVHKDSNGKVRFTKETIDEMLQDCPITRSLTGILSGMGDVDLDEMRMERLSRHLK